MGLSNNEILAVYRKEHGIDDGIEMYTPQVWYKKGYQVKKRSVCKYRIKLHPKGKHYLKEYSLFTIDQVEKRT